MMRNTRVGDWESLSYAPRVTDGGVMRQRLETPLAVHARLEQSLLERPDDEATAGVYADFLMSKSDPRGQLAALVQTGSEWRAFAKQHARGLTGRGPALGTTVTPTFMHGLVTGLEIRGADMAETTSALLEAPVARLVRSLRFGVASTPDNDWGPTLDAVCRSSCAAQLKELRFNAYTHEDNELSWTAFGNFSTAWPRLPSLEVLHIRSGAGGELGALRTPQLRVFIRESGGLARSELEAIRDGEWPRLEHLEVWLGSSAYGGEAEVELVAQLLRGAPQGLRHLGLVNNELIDELVPLLASSELLPQLKSIDLSKCILRSPEVLLRFSHRFRHLSALDLRENLLDDLAARAIVGALPNANVSHQREFDGEDDGDRYCAVGE